MKILLADQLKAWDQYTLQQQGITSLDLMERAANACVEYILSHYTEKHFLLFCGPGNNGGDGLAIARLLHEKKISTTIVGIWESGSTISPDQQINREKLSKWQPIHSFEHIQELTFDKPVVIIDAILGMGQVRPLSGLFKKAVEWINASGNHILSIDIPTGLFQVCQNPEDVAIQANTTLTFEVPKLPFFFPENDRFVGDWHVLSIGLDESFLREVSAAFSYTTSADITSSSLLRKKFSHKGSFGTAYLFAGQVGMAGAAILASKACLRSGVGKLIIRIPKDCLNILQSSVPEAICDVDPNDEVLSTFPTDLTQYQSIGIGPGIGKSPLTKALLWKLLRNGVPNLVLDADALNIIAEEGWQHQIPPGSVITPHIKELVRLWGTSENHFQRLMMARNKAIELRIVVVIKGAHTAVISPSGDISFNSTGNAGLAKAGTGDILTGMITGILAQGYQITEGVKRAVFLHGSAADRLSQERELESFLASDIVNSIGLLKI